MLSSYANAGHWVTSVTSLRRFAGLYTVYFYTVYKMWSQGLDGRSPLSPNLEIYCLAQVYINTSARWDTMACVSKTLRRYIRRITVNVIEAYYKAKNITNVII